MNTQGQYQSTIVKLGLYDVKWEQAIKESKSIDVLSLIDSRARNGVYTLRMLEQLQKDLNVTCIVNNKRFYNYYKDNTSVPLIYNNKFSHRSEKTFHDLIKDSKVYVEFSNRITLGRNIYEALFQGCIVFTPNTYGVSNFFPEHLILDTNLLNFWVQKEILQHIATTYSKDEVRVLRKQVKGRADITIFIKELKEKTNG
jgi:hypothetical protein